MRKQATRKKKSIV